MFGFKTKKISELFRNYEKIEIYATQKKAGVCGYPPREVWALCDGMGTEVHAVKYNYELLFAFENTQQVIDLQYQHKQSIVCERNYDISGLAIQNANLVKVFSC